jgi:hypothetical protein
MTVEGEVGVDQTETEPQSGFTGDYSSPKPSLRQVAQSEILGNCLPPRVGWLTRFVQTAGKEQRKG